MDDLFYQVSKSKVKSVEMTRIAVPKLTKEKLELGDKDKEIIQIKRVRILENRSFAYTVNHLPLEIGARVREKDLYVKPLLQIMEQDLGIAFTEAYQTIEASFANQEVAEKLGIQSGSPVLFVERIMYGKNKKPIELVQSSYLGDLYKYIIRLKNIKRKERNIWVHRPM
jgi:GntR family transcriptional regulator